MTATTKSIVLIICLLSIISCGKKDPTATTSTVPTVSTACQNSPFLGLWDDSVTGDRLTLTSDCVLKDTSCHYIGTVQFQDNNTKVTFTVTTADDSSRCLSKGQNLCNITAIGSDGKTMNVSCLNGDFTYTR